MRVLLLGNSFTYFHEMPQILAGILNAEVVAHTRGGAYLAEQLDPETEMGARTLAALRGERWDAVVLQEQSFGPVREKEGFLRSAAGLCGLAREAGATPVLYATWAYREGSEKLAGTGMSYGEMARALFESYHEAGRANAAPVADVGERFTALRQILSLYEPDDYHPSEAGSALIAGVLAQTLASLR